MLHPLIKRVGKAHGLAEAERNAQDQRLADTLEHGVHCSVVVVGELRHGAGQRVGIERDMISGRRSPVRTRTVC